ncbi:MAG TPA: hypothetical protein VEP90_07055, partial [Methylomirabilota bacterium]|nr:hypothetical protein [Methylomirabilota bacterium]
GRIATYTYHAPGIVMGIDGLQPLDTFFVNNPYLPPYVTREANIWYGIPARPNKLNQHGRLVVVIADVLGDEVADHAFALRHHIKLPRKSTYQEASYVWRSNQEAQQVSDSAILTEDATAATASIALGLAIGKIMKEGAKYLPKQDASQQPAEEQINPLLAKKHRMTRRAFMKKALQYTAAGAVATQLLNIGRNEVHDLAGHAQDEPTEQLWETIDSYLKPRLLTSTWLDGRSDRLVLATDDARKEPGIPQQAEAIVMVGVNHNAVVQEDLRNPSQRGTAARAYAEELLSMTKQIYAGYYHIPVEEVPDGVTNAFLDYFTTGELVEVIDPEGPSFQPEFGSHLKRYVQNRGTFHSPQLEAAIAHLRPKQIP